MALRLTLLTRVAPIALIGLGVICGSIWLEPRAAATVFGAGMFLCAAVAWWQIRDGQELEQQVRELATMMHQLADGSLPPLEALPDSGDELGELAGAIRRMAAQIQDQFAALEAARDHAEIANTSKSAFLANMSHELRTPLNAIIGYAELISEEVNDDDNDYGPLARDIERILLSARHLLGLINDILDISKIEAGEMKVDVRHVDLHRLIREVGAAVETLVKKRGNTLILDVADEFGKLDSDAQKIRQILLNLVGNAAKFTDDGTITLRARQIGEGDDEAIRFEIIDTGIGIAKHKLELLFEPFVQADASSSRRFGGTGLGLTICRHFADMLGGTLTAESEPDRGSTFTLMLPMRAQPKNPDDSGIYGI